MSNEMIETLGKLIAAIFVGIVAYLTPKIKAWFEVHTTKTSQETIKILIKSFVQAAEQLLHDTDDDGTKRMDYVKNQLTAIGIGITEDIVSMIEGAVWEVNNQNRHNPQNKVRKNGNS